MCTERTKGETEYAGNLLTWKNLYWRNSIGHDDDYDSIMQFGNRTHLVYSFRSNHIAIIGRYIEFHQYLYGIYDETF